MPAKIPQAWSDNINSADGDIPFDCTDVVPLTGCPHSPIALRVAACCQVPDIRNDVTDARHQRISYGPTSVIDPDGSVVDQASLLKEVMVTVKKEIQ